MSGGDWSCHRCKHIKLRFEEHYDAVKYWTEVRIEDVRLCTACGSELLRRADANVKARIYHDDSIPADSVDVSVTEGYAEFEHVEENTELLMKYF